MSTTTAIPCKRPKVTVEPSTSGIGLFSVECWVPRCDQHVYGPAVKSDAEQHARWHRGAHRRAVPATKIVHGVEWDVYCDPCGGHRRTFGTRVDAEAWLNSHLSTDHGLVAC